MDFGIPEIVLGIPEISPYVLFFINWVIFLKFREEFFPKEFFPKSGPLCPLPGGFPPAATRPGFMIIYLPRPALKARSDMHNSAEAQLRAPLMSAPD